MNVIPVPASAKTLRRHARPSVARPLAACAGAPRSGPRTRRLAAVLAAVLALGGLAGSAQAATEEPRSLEPASSEQTLWDAIAQLWAEWLGDDQAISLADDEGGSVDPETGDPK